MNRNRKKTQSRTEVISAVASAFSAVALGALAGSHLGTKGVSAGAAIAAVFCWSTLVTAHSMAHKAEG